MCKPRSDAANVTMPHHGFGIDEQIVAKIRCQRLGEPDRIPVEIPDEVGFGLDQPLGSPEILPYGHSNKGEEHGVDHTHDRDGEAGHLIVRSPDPVRHGDMEHHQSDY